MHKKRAYVLASCVQAAVERRVGIGFFHGIEAGGEGALEQMAAGYTFAAIDDRMWYPARFEDAPYYRAFASGIEAVDD